MASFLDLSGLQRFWNTKALPAIRAKYTKPSTGIPMTDLVSTVQDILNKAANDFNMVSDELLEIGIGFGMCTTAASTTSKVVTAAGYRRKVGSMLLVRFSAGNTCNSNFTLDVNETGAATARIPAPRGDTTYLGMHRFAATANSHMLFVFDGSYYCIIGFDTRSGLNWYGACTTASGTSAKTVTTNSVYGFVRAVGSRISVLFSNGNTAPNPSLNVSDTGSATIRYKGINVTPEMLPPGHLADLVFDGSFWQLLNPAIAPATEVEFEKLYYDIYNDNVSINAAGTTITSTGDNGSVTVNITYPSNTQTRVVEAIVPATGDFNYTKTTDITRNSNGTTSVVTGYTQTNK